MESEWIDTTIGEQVTLQRGIDITRATQRKGRVPVISSGGVSSYHDTSAASGPGVVLGRKGVVGSVYFITSDYWPHDTTLWVRDFHGNYPRFVYYFFLCMASQLARMDVGSANPTLNRNHIHPIAVRWPPYRQQEAIADILGKFDDKITLNLQVNESLEKIARAVFRAWFIDFLPVRAKIGGEGGFRGMPQEVFDRLPVRFVDSEIGPIPASWDCIPIGDLVEVVGGNTPSTKTPEFWGGENAFCTPKDMSRLTSPVLVDTERKITQQGVDTISSGQLPVGTVLLSSRAPIGYLAIAETPVSVNQGIIAMRPGITPNIYILLWTESNMEAIKARAGGSTFAEISKQSFRPIPALRPDERTLAAFGDVTRSLFDLIAANLRESAVLGAIRDGLLPKLISGRMNLPGSEGVDNGR
jgi:type I restriction enzyme S subunit